MLIKIGSKIKTDFCIGNVVEIIDGREMPGWKHQLYFVVKVTTPKVHYTRARHIVRMDEIKEVMER